MARKHNKYISQKIRNIQAIARQYYEPGNQSKSYRQVWRRYVYPVYPCHYVTFMRYMNTPPSQLTD
jgi:hypothetical protein